MSEEPGTNPERLPRSLLLHAEQVCRRFETAWRGGGRPRIEDCLVGEPEAVARFLLQELLLVELEYRGQAGEGPRPEEYLQCFPGLDRGWLHGAAGPASTALGGPPARTVPEPARPRPGRCFGDYELLEELGRGGMGVVYKARQTKLQRVVALKMILAGVAAGEAHLARFQTEAEAVARLQHPHIVQIYEVGEHDGLPFFSLEFCPGGSLEKKLRDNPLPALEAATLVEKFARGMEAAHQNGVIHRDLKPANVLLAADGTPKITDFGLARKLDEAGQTASGAIVGTPSYMAPEQADGHTGAIGPAADVYALGAILYECLTGRPPFRAASVLETLQQVLTAEPAPPTQVQPQVPRDLETVCLKCLHKEAARRYASAQHLADDLRRYQEGRPVVARPVTRWERAAKWTRRNPALAVALAAVAAALLLGTAVSWSFALEARHQAADAVGKGNKLAAANDTLRQTVIDLEKTLAQSLLAPLALQGGTTPMSDPEWEALWKLAAHRPGRLGYHFVEEAARGPVTSQQLCDRAALALPAAVGLDLELRDEVEALLLARLEDASVGAEHKTALARAAAAWDALGSGAASRTARHLVQAMKDTREPNALQALAQELSAVSARLEPKEAAQTAAEAAATLTRAMKDTKNTFALRSLAQGLSAVAARLEPKEAAATLIQAIKDTTKDWYALYYLAEGLSAVSGRLEPKEAAQVAAMLTQAMKDTKAPDVLQFLAQALSAVSGRLEPKEAAQAAAGAAAILTQAIKDNGSAYAQRLLAEGLSAVSARLEPKEAAQVAATLTQAMKDTKGPDVLLVLARGLSAASARLEPKEAVQAAAQAAATLTRAMKDTKQPGALPDLARGLSAVSGRLEPKEAARAAAQAAATLIQAMKDTKDGDVLYRLAQGLATVSGRLEPKEAAQAAATLLQAIKDTKDPYALQGLAQGLSAVATRLEPKEAAQAAAQAAATLTQAIKDTKDPYALRGLAQGLSAVAAWLEPKEAARAAAQVAATLTQAMKDTKNPLALEWLAEGLSAVSGWLEPQEAAQAAAQAAATLTQAIKDTKEPAHLQLLAQELSAVSARLEPTEAAATLTQAMKDTKDPFALQYLAEGLSAVSARLGPKEAAQAAAVLLSVLTKVTALNPNTQPALVRSFSLALTDLPPAAHRLRSVDLAVAVCSGSGGDPFLSLAFVHAVAEPLPCRFSTQQLVELLKMPTCVGAGRRVVLDHLGNRYRRPFADVWQFVRFAQQQRLDLDFTSPPRRPE